VKVLPLGPDIGMELVTAYDKYCLYDASLDAYIKIESMYSLNNELEFYISWGEFRDSSIIADLRVKSLQDALRRAMMGVGYVPNDYINRSVVNNIIARCDGKSLAHLQLIPLLFTERDPSFTTPIGANFILAEPLLEYTHECPKDCPVCGDRVVSTPLGTGCTGCGWRFEWP
jgi:hypothetical protein